MEGGAACEAAKSVEKPSGTLTPRWLGGRFWSATVKTNLVLGPKVKLLVVGELFGSGQLLAFGQACLLCLRGSEYVGKAALKNDV